MKTAMQELIELLDSMMDNGGDFDLFFTKSKAHELIEKEKSQIVDAFTAGQMDIAKSFFDEYKERGFEKTLDEFALHDNDKEDGGVYYSSEYKDESPTVSP